METAPPGYYFHPSASDLPFGHPQVDIYISGKPTERFFDTARAVFLIAGGSGLHDLVVTHPWEAWEGASSHRICAGKFRLYEPDGDLYAGFSMGGELDIHVRDDMTVCSLTSSAPIFNLQDDPESPCVLLINFFEALLAEREAAWGENEAGFADRLQRVDPMALFIAVVAAQEQEINLLPAAVRGSHCYQPVSRALKTAIHALQEDNLWPAEVPRLEDLL
jgi:hypothetical protein